MKIERVSKAEREQIPGLPEGVRPDDTMQVTLTARDLFVLLAVAGTCVNGANGDGSPRSAVNRFYEGGRKAGFLANDGSDARRVFHPEYGHGRLYRLADEWPEGLA